MCLPLDTLVTDVKQYCGGEFACIQFTCIISDVFEIYDCRMQMFDAYALKMLTKSEN